MKLNKEQITKIRKLTTALSITGALTIGNIIVTSNFINLIKNDIYLETHFKGQQRAIEYYTNVHNADLSMYDINFVEFYRNGVISSYGVEYPLSEIYLMEGKQNGVNKIFLVSSHNPNRDLVSNQIIDNFEREEVYLFKRTNLCYNLYQSYVTSNTLNIAEDNARNIQSLVDNFDKTYHTLVPETFYLENKKNSKV